MTAFMTPLAPCVFTCECLLSHWPSSNRDFLRGRIEINFEYETLQTDKLLTDSGAVPPSSFLWLNFPDAT